MAILKRKLSINQQSERLIKGLGDDLARAFRQQQRIILRYLRREEGKGQLAAIDADALLWRVGRGLPVVTEATVPQPVDPEQFRLVSALIADLDAELRRAAMGDEKLGGVLAQWARKAAILGGAQGLSQMGIKLAFNLRDPLLLQSITNRVAYSARFLGETTVGDLRSLLVNQFYEQGKHPYQMTGAIRELFEETYKGRAKVIARTEIGSAQSHLQFETLSRNGVTTKIWSARLDGKEREAHRALNGQEQDMQKPFQSILGPIMHPHDNAASAANTIACRCTLLMGKFREIGEPWTGGAKVAA